MDYKNNTAARLFLSDDEDEHTKRIFFNLDDLKRNGKFEDTCDYILKDWFNDYIVSLPITTPIFFDLIQNGRKHSYKATPEKMQTIIQCLKNHQFDEILSETPISSDPPFSPEFVKVSGFGIRIYPPTKKYIYENRAGSFFNYLIKDKIPKCVEEQLKHYQMFVHAKIDPIFHAWYTYIKKNL